MYKQIIIARRDLQMSPGKLSAQVAHGSMAFLTRMIRNHATRHTDSVFPAFQDSMCKEEQWYRNPDLNQFAKEARKEGKTVFYAKPEDPKKPFGNQIRLDRPNTYVRTAFNMDADLYDNWIDGEFTKCVLGARNKAMLLKAKQMAENMGMKEGTDFFMIRDNCHTELEPEEDGRTLTVIGFRPMESETIDQIGRKFQLY